MAVQCAHCGEELLGSVNRCWKCGRSLIAHAGRADIPPVRRAPIVGPLDAPLAAMLVEEPVLGTPQSKPIRTGSPFGTSSPAPTVSPARIQPALPAYKVRNTAADLASMFSIAMGVIAMLIAYSFWPGALAIATAGVGFAIWGLTSTRRILGAVGLSVCVMAYGVTLYVLSTLSW